MTTTRNCGSVDDKSLVCRWSLAEECSCYRQVGIARRSKVESRKGDFFDCFVVDDSRPEIIITIGRWGPNGWAGAERGLREAVRGPY